MLSRREFLTRGIACAACTLACATPLSAGTAEGHRLTPFTRKARYYRKLARGVVQCTLCPRGCVVEPGKRGRCRVRENQGGEYVTLVYGNPCAVHMDPVEKKPFYHLLPGAQAFSFATAGCNFSCTFCQNWEISQSKPENVDFTALSPAQAVKEARRQGASILVGTYNEPVIFYDYMLDVAREARKGGLKAAIVSNGFIRSEPLKELCQAVDAVKIDLKSFRDEFYRKICSGSLAPVLESIRTIRQSGTWLEIVYLIVPSLNDSLEEIKEMSLWIKKELGSDVPLHFSRFHPMYKLTHLPSTPVDTLKKACDTARTAGLRYVYLGNLPGDRGESTCCPHCGKMVIERFAFTIRRNLLKEGKCPSCGTGVPGIWH